jgi:hypothetical protein
MDVVNEIRAGFTSRKHRIGRKSKNCNKRVPLQSIKHHELLKIEGRKKICRECSLFKQKNSFRPFSGNHLSDEDSVTFLCVGMGVLHPSMTEI